MATPTPRSPALRIVVALIALAVSAFTYLSRGQPQPTVEQPRATPPVINARLEPAQPTPSVAPTPTPPARAERAPTQPTGPTIKVSELPPEAQETLRLIDKGGPFPYERDGIEFQNREGRLPAVRRGYYREYTVPTPGASNRGARRIIRGEEDEAFYTDDHYETFKAIVR